MARGNPGKVFKIINGTHKDKLAIALNRDQTPETAKARKVCATVSVEASQGELFTDPTQIPKMESKRVLIGIERLQLIGFID